MHLDHLRALLNTHKKCKKCSNFKPFDEFYAAPKNADGFQNTCKACWKAAQNAKRLAEKTSAPTSTKAEEPGHLYVIFNPAFPDQYKVGSTSSLTSTLRQANGFDPARAWSYIFSWETAKPEALCAYVLTALGTENSLTHGWYKVGDRADFLKSILTHINEHGRTT
jgi:hypothetical protein